MSLHLRRAEPALAIGDYAELELEPAVLSFQRRHAQTTFTVLLNFSAEARRLVLPPELAHSALVLSTHPERSTRTVDERFALEANEGVILRNYGVSDASHR